MVKNVWCFCFLVIWKYLKNTKVYRLSEKDIWLIRKAVIIIAQLQLLRKDLAASSSKLRHSKLLSR